MIKKFEIPFNGKHLPAIINLNTIRNFSREKGLKKVADFADVISPADGEDVTFEMLDNFALLLTHAIREGARQSGQKVEITPDDIYTMFDNQADLMSSIREAVNDDDADTDTDVPDQEEPESKKKMKSPGKNSNKSA